MNSSNSSRGRTSQFLLAALFGFLFGFFLQKGGVAKYHILMGVLLLEDFTVIKVMLTAILVGMIGVYTLHALGQVELKIKPTRLASNLSGGLIFGVGFGLAGYCPGTTSAALGQGNYDALAVMVGMVAGSYCFAELSRRLARTLDPIGDRGKLTLPELFRVPLYPFIAGFAVLLAIVLFFLNQASALN
jgi:uncharacterized membrane protein YedE/YeeE